MVSTRYVGTRLLQALVTVYAVITITFGLIRLMPGGPMDFLQAQLTQQMGNMDREQLMAIMEVYMNIQPNQPVWEQYITYVTSVLQGDLGRSIVHNEAVSTLLAGALPWTIFVMSLSLLIFWIFGVVVGALMAYTEGSRFDMVFSLLAIVFNSVPYYVFAVFFVFLFGNMWGILPAGGRMNADVTPGVNAPFVRSVIYHAVLPVASLIIASWGGVALGMRGNSISTLGEDYIRVGRLRGLPVNRLSLHYVARNAVLPLYTRFMISIGFILGGSIILETIFRYEGVGFYLFRAISQRDYPLLMGGFLIITIAVVVGIFVADLTYGKIDPRVASGDRS